MMTTWLREIRKEFPDAIVPLMSEFGEAWRRENPNNDKLDYRFVQRGTGLPRIFSEANLEIRWYMNRKFRLATLRDWTKDVHTGESLNGITWMQTAPLPSYILTYLMEMRAAIKTESGANDQARGQTSSGVTAASAISALQQMATKRSTMHSQGFHAKFKQAYRMLLDVEREFAQSERKVVFMSHGRPKTMIVRPDDFKAIGDDGKPIEYHIIIETSDQTQYSKIANNELALQIGTMFRDTIDPISVLYMMDFQDKDLVIETIQDARNSQLMQMQAQIQQLTQMVEQLTKQNNNYKRSYAEMLGAQAQSEARQQAQQRIAEQSAESEPMGEEEQEAMLQNLAKA
jgi:hypothetical protein